MGAEIMAKIKAIFSEAKNRMQVTDETIIALPVVIVQKPKTFKHRDHIVFVSLNLNATEAFTHPTDEKYSYDNYLTGLQSQPDSYNFFNSIFKDQSRGWHNGAIPADAKEEILNPQQAPVKKIHVKHGSCTVIGIQFKDKDDNVLLDVG